MPWHAVRVEVEAALADPLGDALLEAGAESVTVDEPLAPRVAVHAILPLGLEPARIVATAAAACGLSAPTFTAARLEDDDWVRRTQSQFAPLAVGRRLWIGASWHATPADRQAVVRLNPGMAFGTGSHPSTRLTLEFLEATIGGEERVLDYGCGSGILAIAAAKLGARLVDGVDIDPLALETAAANATANGVALRCYGTEELPEGQYDVVVANILAQPLIALAPLLLARLARGGRIALSGILEGQAGEVAQAYRNVGAQVSRLEEGWALVEGVRA
ncbi:MAG: 50S ribosomal protein L11 methyltransferase [Betaproteobacteria bacterium]